MLSEALSLVLLFGVARSDYCTDAPFNTYVYCDYKLAILDRVNDFVGRLTVAEKISQLGTTADPISRLDIPAYEWWSEGLHGVAHSPAVHFKGNLTAATSFPQVIGLAASFNMSLIHAIAQVTSTEARAFANSNQGGLTYFTPNINIFRDPRWGRGQETPGEDTYLNSRYAVNFVKGFQEGIDPRYIKVVPTCKHYAAYDLEDYQKLTRHSFDAIVPDQDLHETYLPVFRACVEEAEVASIMCSYNAVNGVPSCADDYINNQVARNEWGFKGFIVSDCGAIDDIINTHNYTKTNSETVRAGLRGGCDLNCGKFYQSNAMEAYTDGSITDDDLNLAMTRLFTYRMRLGMFDPPDLQPYMSYTAAMVNTKEHQNLALDAARDGIVLLQNNGILPLDTFAHHSVAVIGPNANNPHNQQGNYEGDAPYLITPVNALIDMSLTVSYVEGCNVACTSQNSFIQAYDLVKKVDAVIVVLGLDQGQESEGHDRTSLTLPGYQEDLLKELKVETPSSTPFIVVLMSGGPVDITAAKALADAILWVGYPGQSGGQAIAEIIYGKVNPSGRLPVTFYPADYVNEISYTDMSMRTSPGRSYKFYTGTPVFPFGYGLSYTTFVMQWTNLPNKTSVNLRDIETVLYKVDVTNTGKVSGSVSVLAYITADVPGAPLKELFGFEKVFLKPGEKTHLSFAAEPNVFATVDVHGKREIKSGNYLIRIGDDLVHRLSIF